MNKISGMKQHHLDALKTAAEGARALLEVSDKWSDADDIRKQALHSNSLFELFCLVAPYLGAVDE